MLEKLYDFFERSYNSFRYSLRTRKNPIIFVPDYLEDGDVIFPEKFAEKMNLVYRKEKGIEEKVE